MSLKPDLETHYIVEGLLADYAACLNENRIEDWAEFFVDDCCYKVLSRENEENGLPAPIIYHYSKGMLRDRATSIRDALTIEYVYTRHMISNTRVIERNGDTCTATSNFTVYQTSEEGESKIYSVGRYIDEVVFSDDGAKFKSKTVIVDTFAIDNQMAMPI